MTMNRIVIKIPESLKRKLDAERQCGASAAGLIRHLLDQHFKSKRGSVTTTHPQEDTDSNIPGWATGPDCFESEAQREHVETQHWCQGDGRFAAYENGDLHVLAQAIAEFRAVHRSIFTKELQELHAYLAALTDWIEHVPET
ncbi:hypothetical protein W02_24840 [Nitrospira sp. KM1]|uniref:hypothetical protein n=1 Tax=Nitrospira sp. KM1 TaxID=1936990 RepID=UPI0013A7811B|nr:hypothetical protein [Nitrospira sp. KM1]BCA55344.1 hypothetical protein W02_24840 [Nitrospira sp. KM1]